MPHTHALTTLPPARSHRNPPYVPLGEARARQQLLEAVGLRVVVLPRFLWRVMSATGPGAAAAAAAAGADLIGAERGDGAAASPDDQMCLLASLLGPLR